MKKVFLFSYFLFLTAVGYTEDGYLLWLRYNKIDDPVILQQYKSQINSIVINGSSPTLTIARNELLTDLNSLLDKKVVEAKKIEDNLTLLNFISATPSRVKLICFCMGQNGLISRLLSPMFGAFLTFASLQKGSETALGQINIEDMRVAYDLLGAK